MLDAAIITLLAGAPTSVLCSADKNVRAMHSSLTPLFRGARLFGPARTARTQPGENAAIHRAIHVAAPGDVLVVDGGGDKSFGVFGDILSTCCLNQQLVGAVIDSTIRDVADIVAMRFPIFCLGACPNATAKIEPGEVNVEIECGGVRVEPGDFISGDDDGVVVVPRGLARDIAVKVQSVINKEADIKRRLVQGETTLEIFNLQP